MSFYHVSIVSHFHVFRFFSIFFYIRLSSSSSSSSTNDFRLNCIVEEGLYCLPMSNHSSQLSFVRLQTLGAKQKWFSRIIVIICIIITVIIIRLVMMVVVPTVHCCPSCSSCVVVVLLVLLYIFKCYPFPF